VEEKEIPEPTPIGRGIDVSGISIMKGLGFLTLKKFRPWGTILVADSNKTILAKGDIIYVNFVEKKEINPGDVFTISKSSPRLNHPLTDKPLGYAISFNGRFVIKEKMKIKEKIKRNIYKAEIVEIYRDVHVGDMAIPWEPISPCVQPTSFGKKMIENIVATKDQKDLIGPLSIVYLNRGFLQGIRRGVVFEIVKKRVIPDPEIKRTTVFNYNYYKKMELPDLVIGRLIILETRPDTATALVLSAKEEFQNGSYIKALSWVETPEFITMIPTCSLE
jgi:hypothetical protein